MSDDPGRDDSDERLVCFCHFVTRARVRRAIREEGARTLADIQEKTRASTGCGGCEYDVREILEEELGKTGETSL